MSYNSIITTEGTRLTQLGLNCTAEICSIDDCAINRSTYRRLAELGLRAGQPITVIQKTTGGGRIVKASSARYALDKQLASAIHVPAGSHRLKTSVLPRPDRGRTHWWRGNGVDVRSSDGFDVCAAGDPGGFGIHGARLS